jgi:hypothetical protein
MKVISLGGQETFPSEPTRQSCDHDQRGQGCAALEGFQDGLDLDDRAKRGRMMAGRRLIVALARGRSDCPVELSGQVGHSKLIK